MKGSILYLNKKNKKSSPPHSRRDKSAKNSPSTSTFISGSRPSAISLASLGFSGNLELRTTVLHNLCFCAHQKSQDTEQARIRLTKQHKHLNPTINYTQGLETTRTITSETTVMYKKPESPNIQSLTKHGSRFHGKKRTKRQGALTG
jgi:hypothetical protein